jgi:hypothetical protein
MAIAIDQAVETDAVVQQPNKEFETEKILFKSAALQNGNLHRESIRKPSDSNTCAWESCSRSRSTSHVHLTSENLQQRSALLSAEFKNGTGAEEIRDKPYLRYEAHGVASPLVRLMNSSVAHLTSLPRLSAYTQSTGKSASEASLGHSSELCAANAPALKATVQTHNEDDDPWPEYVIDKDLEKLGYKALLSQCWLREKLTVDSENHERELAEAVTTLEDELSKLRKDSAIEIEHLREENASLKKKIQEILRETSSKLLQKSGKLSVSLRQSLETVNAETLTGTAETAVQMITILFTSKLQDFKIWKIVAHGCEGAVFVAESLHRGSNLLIGKRFALKVLFNVFGHSTFTKVTLTTMNN